MTQELRVFGLSEDALRHRLADLLEDRSVEVTLSVCEGHGIVTVTASSEAVADLTEEIRLRLSGSVYSDSGESLATCVVRLLTGHGLTVATAESCTGGLIAAALTDVPGASKVLGTGVVSYSNTCKERLLSVSPDTIANEGAVSAATAGQMARGVRRTAESALGVSVTGEAGPTPAENWPVGTVFIALADKKRTWVEELHLDGPDRAAIRRQAADRVLWLLWRYLSAYPTVIAGGEKHAAVQRREIPRTRGERHPRLLSRILPWRGDSRRRLLMKCTAWLAVLAVLAVFVYMGYLYLSAGDRNRELQSSLGELYWESTDLTDVGENTAYPQGMLPAFRGLYDLNRDVGGWLYIPGSGVDYPVMKYAEGYYRNHSFMQEYSIYGQLYFGPSGSKRVSCVYGQNPGDGQMFSDLLHYRRLSYLQGHGTIQCNTLTANENWQIFAVVVVDEEQMSRFSYLPNKEFSSDKAFQDYLDGLCRRSLFTASVTPSVDDRILLLTTEAEEEYEHSGARLVVAARQITEPEEEVTYRVNPQVKLPTFLAGTTRRDTTTTRGDTTGDTTLSTTGTTQTVSTTTTTQTDRVTDTTGDTTTSSTDSTGTTETTLTTETAPTTEGSTVPTQAEGTEQ